VLTWCLVLHRNGLLAVRRSPILVLTGPSVAQLIVQDQRITTAKPLPAHVSRVVYYFASLIYKSIYKTRYVMS